MKSKINSLFISTGHNILLRGGTSWPEGRRVAEPGCGRQTPRAGGDLPTLGSIAAANAQVAFLSGM